jgi:hypothetical protein
VVGKRDIDGGEDTTQDGNNDSSIMGTRLRLTVGATDGNSACVAVGSIDWDREGRVVGVSEGVGDDSSGVGGFVMTNEGAKGSDGVPGDRDGARDDCIVGFAKVSTVGRDVDVGDAGERDGGEDSVQDGSDEGSSIGTIEGARPRLTVGALSVGGDV